MKKCNEFLDFLKHNKGYTAEVVTSQVNLSPQKPGGGSMPIKDEIKVCLQCGRPNGRSNKFCLACGKKFDELDADASMLAKALAPDSKTLEDWMKKARSFSGTGDLETALEYYEKLMTYKGNDVAFWNEIGKLLQKLGRNEAAREAFDKAAQSEARPSASPSKQADQETPSRYCPKCGKKNKNTAKFCLACGAKFS